MASSLCDLFASHEFVDIIQQYFNITMGAMKSFPNVARTYIVCYITTIKSKVKTYESSYENPTPILPFL